MDHLGCNSSPIPILTNENRCPPYCDCEFPNCIAVNAHKGSIGEMVTCRCAEEGCILWTWDTEFNDTTDAFIQEQDVTFHPTFSQGTAIVRGNYNLKIGMVHFWEIRILTVPSGTDFMIGVGKDNLDLEQYQFHFLSALGSNNKSWGFSYNGQIQHDGLLQTYGQKFSQGCIVGVCVDRVRGTLEFFLNRRSLGIAYSNIPTDPNIKLYPLVSSTAARSAIRLINSTSQKECLQLQAFKALSKQPKVLDELRAMPGLRLLLDSYWFYAPPIRYSHRSAENELDIGDEAVLSFSRRARKQKFKDDEEDINDIYSNAHKISARSRSQSNGDIANAAILNAYFDEYFHFIF